MENIINDEKKELIKENLKIKNELQISISQYENIKRILKEDTDYKYAVGIETGDGRACIIDDLYEIRRINIHPKTSDIFHFSRKVKGNYIFKKEMKKNINK